MFSSWISPKCGERWTPFRTIGMNLDTKRLVGMFPRSRSEEDGYITPPLHYPRSRSSSNGRQKRIWVVALLILMFLYLCGFTLPGYQGGNKKIVIILAANLGGGECLSEISLTSLRCVGCQEFRRLGFGEVEHSK